MDIHLLEILNQELLQQCQDFQKYLDKFNELPGSGSSFGTHMGILTDRFIQQQWNEYHAFQKIHDKESCDDIAHWLLEAIETRKLFK